MRQFRRRMKGIPMLDRYGRRRWHTRAAPALLAITLAFTTLGAAVASEDEEDVPADTKFLRSFMNVLGFQRDGTGIEYRERAPLVVPPSRDLPAPQSESATARNPAWPKDPDARRKQATASEKAKLSADRPSDEARPLRPDELEVHGGSVTKRPSEPTKSAEESMRPMTPEQLGQNKTIFDTIFSTFNPRKEAAPFEREPPRTSMTAPPPGYQTPSPEQPYGIDPNRPVSQKPATLEQRLEPAR
jgi:hypothetical protein